MEEISETQVITFQVDREIYGLDVHQIKEIIKVRDCVRLPNSPPSIEGVIHLRGQIIPIIDLRKTFHMAPKKSDENTRIIMAEYSSEIVGLIVDSVIDVASVTQSDIVKPPALTKSNGNEFVTGIVKYKDDLIVVINVVRLMEAKNAADQNVSLASEISQARKTFKAPVKNEQEAIIVS